ncbi:VOC family protein [Amycolatopsis sp. YIM 10]|uniref:VOC family protein n=1 Tax=Amycolatopsis sp. YIM 10 TaxID=2653857 RepID=UPI0012A8D675|nr:VOC family protein [Amycolatopsis sp. YIM 10]QFU92370.1 transcriptional regulator BetI [Amycolatopsis sp. YIM 10]
MPKKVDPDERRGLIARALVRLATERGLEAVSLRQVATEAGLSMGAVQHYFRTKDEMLLYALQYQSAERDRRITERVLAIAEHPSPKDIVRTCLAELLPVDEVTRAEQLIETAFFIRALTEPEMRQVITEGTPKLIDFFAGLLRTAQAAGDVAADRDPVQEARLLWSMVDSLRTSVILEECSADEVLTTIDYYLDRLFRPRSKLAVVVVDCPDPRALAPFYEKLLGAERTKDGPDSVELALGGEQPALALHRTEHYLRPDWATGEPAQQLHLDLLVADLDEAEREVLALGGQLLDGSDKPIGYRVYADPAGHPFCLVTPEGLG